MKENLQLNSVYLDEPSAGEENIYLSDFKLILIVGRIGGVGGDMERRIMLRCEFNLGLYYGEDWRSPSSLAI